MAAVNKKLMAELFSLDGAVTDLSDPYATGIETPSPSLNRIFDNTWLLPDGYCLLLGGEPKGGKSVIVNSIVGHTHKSDPDAVVLKYNTEFREKAQLTDAQVRLWGIDRARYAAYETNDPAQIFDPIETRVPKLIQQGLKIRLVVIDSVNEILGRRGMNADTVMTQQIGDEAKTLQDGFKRIKGLLRRHGVSLILTCQVRAEMDVTEQMRGNKVKLAVPFYVKHTAEYFAFVERFRNKAGKTDLTGQEFVDKSVKVDMSGQKKGDGEESAHKVRVTMKDSSVGRAGRQAIFTLDHDRGIINTHEEVFLIGVGTGVIDTETRGYFRYAPLDRNYHGQAACLQALKEDTEFYDAIIRDAKKLDLDRRAGILRDPPPVSEDDDTVSDVDKLVNALGGAGE